MPDHQPADDGYLIISQCIVLSGKRKPSLANHVKHGWLHVMDGLVAIKRSTGSGGEESIPLWETFGQLLGMDVNAARQEDASTRSSEVEGLLGCYWLRCPLNGPVVDPVREMMLCKQCRMVRISRISFPCTNQSNEWFRSSIVVWNARNCSYSLHHLSPPLLNPTYV